MRIPRPGQKVKLLGERPLRTPFGRVELPEIELPPLRRPHLDGERRQAVRQALGADASDIVGLIPFVGDSLSRNLETIHQQAMRKSLTEEEMELYWHYKRSAPFDSVSLLRAFVKKDTGV